MEHDADISPKAFPAVSDPLPRVKTIQDSEAHIFPFTFTVRPQIEEHDFISLIMEKLCMRGIVHGLAGKAVMEDHHFVRRSLSREMIRMKLQTVARHDAHLFRLLLRKPLPYRGHGPCIFRHLHRIRKLIDDILAGFFGADQRLPDQHGRSNPSRHSRSDRCRSRRDQCF